MPPSSFGDDPEVSEDGSWLFKCAGSGLTVPRLFQSIYVPLPPSARDRQWLTSYPLPVLPSNVTPTVWCPSAHPVRHAAADGAAGQPNDPGACWHRPGKGIMAR